MLEYFINTHGARRVWPTLRCVPPTQGYLTRRLVDVSQDVIVRETDCGTPRGINVALGEKQPDWFRSSATRTWRPRVRPHHWPPTRSTPMATSSSNVAGSTWAIRRSRRCWPPASPRSGPLGAHLRHRHRCVRTLLRTVDGHRQAVDIGGPWASSPPSRSVSPVPS